MSRLCLDLFDSEGHVLKAIAATAKTVTLGSAPGSDVVITGADVPALLATLDVDALSLEVHAAGLRVNGQEATGQVSLDPGAEIQWGEVRACLLDWRPGQVRPFSSYAYFEQRGAEECLRCQRAGGTFSTLYVRDLARQKLEELEGALASTVRLPDVVAAYCPGTYVMILFGAGEAEAALVAARTRRVLEYLEVDAQVGTATWPHDGKSIDALGQLAAQRAVGVVSDDSDVTSTGNAALGPEQHLTRVAQSNLSILVLGETGSGKEVLAARIHKLSPRNAMPYVKLNCAAFTESLLESELFGHERGAFTGATATKPGLLETAQGGTVFLDEVGEMPPSMQAKMLRVLEDRVVLRVGGLKPIPVDVRFIAATNRDLETEISRGKFRSDLFYRLDGATIVVPPLRSRLSEFDAIARDLLNDITARSNRPPMTVSPNALAVLKQYRWPGNIRELRNMLERASWLAGGQTIRRSHLPLEKLQGRFAEYRPDRYAPAASGTLTRLDDPPPANPPSPGIFDGRKHRDADEGLRDEEKRTIEQMLRACGGNQSEAARRLGISRRTLINRIEAYGLARPRKT